MSLSKAQAHWRRKFKFYAYALVLMLLCYMFWWEPDSLRVQTHRLELTDWPERLHGLEVAVLSDLHMGAPYMTLDKLQEIVNLTNQQQAGLVLISGDILVSDFFLKTDITLDAIAQMLAKLRAPLGVWVVLGNHDHRVGVEPLKQALARAYINLIEERSVLLNYNGKGFWLAGVSDVRKGQPDMNAALKGIPQQDPIILMTHNPDLFTDLPPWVNLGIAGHTHGGQIALSFLVAPLVPSEHGLRYLGGHIKELGHDLFVSTGLGTSMWPLRLGVPPEISLLTLEGS